MVSFLSHSVISGFTSGTAITIGLTQMKYLVGYNITKSHHINVTLQSMFENIDQVRVARMPLCSPCLKTSIRRALHEYLSAVHV